MFTRIALLFALALTACSASDAASPEPRIGPACTSCAWAHEVCVAQAKDMTLADIRAGRCDLVGCFVWHRQRTTACDESYQTCASDCR